MTWQKLIADLPGPKAGDMLYIPAYWFHVIQAEGERNVVVNHWFAQRQGPLILITSPAPPFLSFQQLNLMTSPAPLL